MSDSWDTKWGRRRIRQNPPTLDEALAAAEGLTADREQQIEIAADLMGVDVAEARAEMKRLPPMRRATITIAAPARNKAPRMVVVERKTSRRVGANRSLRADAS